MQFTKCFSASSLITLVLAADQTSNLSLEASLQPLNSTAVKVTIDNTYTEQIGILSWNNHFGGQKSGHGSFSITYQDSNGSVQTLQRGPDMPQFLYGSMEPRHFFSIPANGTHEEVFNLNELFYVPFSGTFKVTVDLNTQAILQPNGINMTDELDKASGNPVNLPGLSVKSQVKEVYLSVTIPHPVQKRDSAAPCSLQGPNAYPAETARTNANKLGTIARQGNSNILYQAYFNDPSHNNIVRAAKVFSGIESYGVDGNYYKVTEFCDPTNIDSSCQDDETTQAYNTIYSDGSSRIVFCQSWFGLDDLDFCSYPSAANQRPSTKQSVFFHELVHSPLVVGYDDIHDGNNCYDRDCIFGAAKGEKGQPASYLIANAYTLYAVAAQALSSSGCFVTEDQLVNNQTSPGGVANAGG